MSTNRIILRRAYRDAVPSLYDHLARERQAARLGLPKISERPTFQEWLASGGKAVR